MSELLNHTLSQFIKKQIHSASKQVTVFMTELLNNLLNLLKPIKTLNHPEIKHCCMLFSVVVLPWFHLKYIFLVKIKVKIRLTKLHLKCTLLNITQLNFLFIELQYKNEMQSHNHATSLLL